MAESLDTAATNNVTKVKNRSFPAEVVISLGLFLLAFLPRVYDLSRFVTADEAKWVYRSAQFLAAFLAGDFPATNVNLTPAVTTTWLGSLGLTLYYYFNQAAINMPFTDWLTSLPEFRTEIPVLVAARWPMAIFTSLGVVVIYLLARRLFNPMAAFIGAAFIALDAHTIALSRILGHDAPVTMFMSISLLLLLLAVREVDTFNFQSPNLPISQSLFSRKNLLLIILSGIAAGLAILSKAPALFLIPFAALILVGQALSNRPNFHTWLSRFLLWAVVAYLTFIAFWPAAWVDPVGQPWAVVENAFLSATDQAEAGAEGYWLVPNLGPFYYLVNGAFKLNPLVMVGLGLAVFGFQPNRHTNKLTNRPIKTLFWLLAFVLLFGLFMTLGDKRSPRYILPAFPPLALVAAVGWLRLFQVAGSKVAGSRVAGNKFVLRPTRTTHHAPRIILPIILTLSAIAIVLPYTPYYFSYFNPLLGGMYTAPHLVKIGWGEGLDQIGRFLQRELGSSRVGTAYASTVAPFFKGDLSNVTGDNLDYVVLYRKQVQSGKPSPGFIRYFEQVEPLFSVELNGIHYADVYPGPALQPTVAFTSNLEGSNGPQPIGFRPLAPYGHIGQPLEVDVLWLADDPLPTSLATVTLASTSVFDLSDTGQESSPIENVRDVDKEGIVLAEGAGHLARLAEDLVVSHHRLPLPEELGRGVYALLVDGQPLGEVELRHFNLPANTGQVRDVVFDRQIGLIGYRFQPTENYIGMTIGWQAERNRLPDYTVFVQFLDAETNERLAGIDTRPLKGEWPTSLWVKDEVVVDEYLVAMPPGLGPGFYKMIVGLYQPETGQRLRRANGQDHWALPFTFIRE